jgi:hypothetical protein
MSCRNPTSPRRPGIPSGFLALVALAALLVLPGCGKKGDPLPPLRNIPLKTNDLDIRQQGRIILFDMGYPATTINGLALGGIDSVELLELVKPLLDDGEPPKVENREFEAVARPVLTLRGSELGSAIAGDRIQFQLPLSEELPEKPVASFFAVRTQKGEEVSSLSNRVSLVVGEPPPAPAELTLEGLAQGIRLSWELETEKDVEGFDVFRREAQVRSYGESLRRISGEHRTYIDKDARYGQRYIYTVRTVGSTDPLVWSAEAGDREIHYEDRFPPPLPKNFVALGERGRVRLRWDPSEADDVLGYVLYRKEPGRDFHPVWEEPLDTTEYTNDGLVAGFSYAYRIQVVDTEGNRSELSDPVTTTVR